MKRISLIIVSIVSFNLIFAQSVTDFKNHYSGQADWNSQTGVLTITESGYLKFPSGTAYPYPYRHHFWQVPGGTNRLDYEYFVWVVPPEVDKIVINANTIVNAAFHFRHSLKIRGEDRATSIIYGTQLRDWNECGNGSTLPGDGYWLSLVNKIYGSGVSEVKNITFLNPKVFCLASLGGNGNFIDGIVNDGIMNVNNCNFVDKRGGGTSNSDGIDGNPGSIIDNCYFETGDDNIKVINGAITVNNCTFKMIENSCPFNIGYGAWSNGASMDAENIRIIGNGGRTWQGSPIIQGGNTDGTDNGYSNVTIVIDGIYRDLANKTLVHLQHPNQHLDVTIYDSNITGMHYYCGPNTFDQYFNSNLTLCYWQPNCNNNACINSDTPCYFNPCLNTEYSGSTVDSYSIPSFAENFICWNDGSNAYGSVNQVKNNAQNGIHINYCCNPSGQYGSENCGYSTITGCNIGTNNYNGGTNPTCQTNITLITSNNVTSGTSNQSASNQIQATNTIYTNANATYTAGNRIILKSGFKALFGSYFNAFIAACNSPKLASTTVSDIVKNNNAFELNEFFTAEDRFNEELQIYPNPLKDKATILYYLQEPDNVTLTMFDATSKHRTTLAENQTQQAGQHQLELDATNLPTGIYYIKLQSKKGYTNQKLIITR